MAPYVSGPALPAAKHNAQPISVSNQPTIPADCASKPSPVKKSEPTFVMEFVFLALLVGTLAAWIANVNGSAMLVMLAIDGALACGVLIGYRVRKSAAGQATLGQDANTSTATTHWAYRATNYRQLLAMDLPRSAQSLYSQGVSSHLQLEAVEPGCLAPGDIILVEEGQTIHADGKVVEGMAIIDESTVTGQSAQIVCHEASVKDVMRDSRVVSGMVFVEVAPRRGHPLDWIGGIGAMEPGKLESARS